MLGNIVYRRVASKVAFNTLHTPVTSRAASRATSGGRTWHNSLVIRSRLFSTSPNRYASGDKPTTKVKKDVKKNVRATKTTGTKGRPKAKATKAKAKKTKPRQSRRDLTAEQLAKLDAAKKAKKDKDAVKHLKEAALLNEPKSGPVTAWSVIFAEHAHAAKGSGSIQSSIGRDAASKYRNLSSAEREHYNHLANENKHAYEQKMRRWVREHTPEQVRLANKARASLTRKSKAALSKKRYSPIQDDRQVKAPATAFALFLSDRHKSGDMKATPVTEAVKLANQEFKALSQSEKKHYDDMYTRAKSQYIQDYSSVYGHPPPSSRASARA